MSERQAERQQTAWLVDNLEVLRAREDALNALREQGEQGGEEEEEAEEQEEEEEAEEEEAARGEERRAARRGGQRGEAGSEERRAAHSKYWPEGCVSKRCGPEESAPAMSKPMP